MAAQHVWAKTGDDPANLDHDQRIHMDWPNNSLICPIPLADGGGTVRTRWLPLVPLLVITVVG